MKFIGQYIQSFISRFRNDVYLEDIDTGTIASGGNLGLDSNNKVVKATVSSGSGDITAVRFTTDTGAGSPAEVTTGAASFGLVGASGVGVINSGTTITAKAVPGEIDHDSLLNFAANEHFTQANITTVGTIGTGVWQGTAIAQAYIANDAINGDKIADDAVDSEHYTDGSIDTAHIADDQVTFAKASGVTPNVYGSIIKVLPSDFMANEEPGVTKTLQFVDNSLSGIKPGDNNTELLAFVSIPEGMKATHVDVYADDTLAFSVYELNIHESVGDLAGASKGTGNCNTTLDITDVNATATNYLLIQVITVAKADRVFGAKVTIAAQ